VQHTAVAAALVLRGSALLLEHQDTGARLCQVICGACPDSTGADYDYVWSHFEPLSAARFNTPATPAANRRQE
jgi:hypothetical protein